MQLNDMYFAGYAGRDAETKVSKAGNEFVTVNVCNTRKNKDGTEESLWLQVMATGYAVDGARGIKKGDNVVAQGQLKINIYKDKDGLDRTSVSIMARSVGVAQRPTRQGDTTTNQSSGDEFDTTSW